MPTPKTKTEHEMDTSSSEVGSASKSTSKPKGKKRFSEKHIKIIVVVAIAAVLLIIFFWTMVPEKVYEVNELSKQGSMNGQEIIVKGVVQGWNMTQRNFTLHDSMDENITLLIAHDGAFPEGFGNNVTVIVKGIWRSSKMMVESHSIQVGCPSKY